MAEIHKPRKEMKLKRITYITGQLKCQRCPITWSVVDLNPERKAVQCPGCGALNDIREAMKGAM